MEMKTSTRTIFLAILIFLFFRAESTTAQAGSFGDELFQKYEDYKEEGLDKRRIKFSDIAPLIKEYKENSNFMVNQVGQSIEGRPLYLLSIGRGETDVFLWSQMHGDESTATRALFDIFNFFTSEGFSEEKQKILSELKIHFLPMLNPDGAEVFERRNALGIDVNRDALRLQSPEARTLKRVRDSLEADFGFNLHDQSKYYNVGRTEKPATVSFLAPAFNYEKDVNEVRKKAIKLIVSMNDLLQKYAPGQVGRYNDDFEPRAFGDNIQKWGTSTILVESGGYSDDPEKQEIRKLNFILLLSALKNIAEAGYEKEAVADYEKIPENDRMLFDLKLNRLKYNLAGEEYILDLGINRREQDIKGNNDFFYTSSISDQGDLSTSYGYNNLDAAEYELKFGKVYPETFKDISALKNLDFSDLLKRGYAYLKLENLPQDTAFTELPIHLVPEDYKAPVELQPGTPATFFLEKNGQFPYAVINGFLVEPDSDLSEIENALILKR